MSIVNYETYYPRCSGAVSILIDIHLSLFELAFLLVASVLGSRLAFGRNGSGSMFYRCIRRKFTAVNGALLPTEKHYITLKSLGPTTSFLHSQLRWKFHLTIRTREEHRDSKG